MGLKVSTSWRCRERSLQSFSSQPIFSFKFENCLRSPSQLANCSGIGIDNKIVGTIFFCQDESSVNLCDRKISEIVLVIYRRTRHCCRVYYGKLSFDIMLPLDGLWRCAQFEVTVDPCHTFLMSVIGCNERCTHEVKYYEPVLKRYDLLNWISK